MLAECLQVYATLIGVMSTRLIQEAAAGYGISEDLLLGQEAKAIAKRYLEDCIEGIRDDLKNQSDGAIRVIEKVMTEQIASVSSSERLLRFKRTLNLQTLSASSLR
jgi:hypothetical protein